jgi:hypothetical protein
MKKLILFFIITSFLFSNYSTTSKISAAFDDDYSAFSTLSLDQVTPSIDTPFLRELSNFTLLSNVTESGARSNFTFGFYTGDTGVIEPGDEILLLDVISNWSFYAEVTYTNANGYIGIDRTIDHSFATNGTICRLVTSEMAVDGSVTNLVYTVRAGTTPIDITRIMLVMTDATAMDDGKFGGLASLSNGITIRVVDGFNKTMFNWDNNGEIGLYCYDTDYVPAAQGPAGNPSFKARITWGGQSKHGMVIRLSGDDLLQIIIRDNLTGLISLKVVAEGHETTGNN